MSIIKKGFVILIHALIGWICCAAVMGIGTAFLPMNLTLIIHLIAAPIFFSIISIFYFKNFHYTNPLLTAVIFTGFIIAMDFFVVALLILKNFDMFNSYIGTWIPFALIFLSTFATGFFFQKRK